MVIIIIKYTLIHFYIRVLSEQLHIQVQNNCNNPAGLALTQAHVQDVGQPLYEVDEQ
jgi:hypothetical protein